MKLCTATVNYCPYIFCIYDIYSTPQPQFVTQCESLGTPTTADVDLLIATNIDPHKSSSVPRHIPSSHNKSTKMGRGVEMQSPAPRASP